MRPALRRALMAGSVAALGLLFGLWFAFVRAPGPQDVCRHIIEVTMRESADQGVGGDGQDAVISQLQDRCVQQKVDKVQLRGRVVWAKYAKCVMAANDLDAIWRC
jgi:hypothetical protein